MAEQTIGYSDIGIAGAEAASHECDLVMTGSGSAGCFLASRLGEDKIASALVLETGEHDRNRLFHWPAGLAGMTKEIAGRSWSVFHRERIEDHEFRHAQGNAPGGGTNAQIQAQGDA